MKEIFISGDPSEYLDPDESYAIRVASLGYFPEESDREESSDVQINVIVPPTAYHSFMKRLAGCTARKL